MTSRLPCTGRDEARPARPQQSERAGPSDQDRDGSNLERKSATTLERRSGNEAQKQAARRKSRPSTHDLHTGGAAYSDREPGLSAQVHALLRVCAGSRCRLPPVIETVSPACQQRCVRCPPRKLAAFCLCRHQVRTAQSCLDLRMGPKPACDTWLVESVLPSPCQ